MHFQRQITEYLLWNIAITRSNQKGSVPGPADYNVKKPLPQSATIANTSQVRNLYKKIEQNPGPGAYESKSYVTVLCPSFRKESKDQLVCVSSTMVKIPPDLKTIKSREVNYSQNLLLFLWVKKANQFSKLILITTHSSQAQLLITKILVFALIVESSLVHPIEKILPRQKKHQGPTITWQHLQQISHLITTLKLELVPNWEKQTSTEHKKLQGLQLTTKLPLLSKTQAKKKDIPAGKKWKIWWH